VRLELRVKEIKVAVVDSLMVQVQIIIFKVAMVAAVTVLQELEEQAEALA
jgi:hypothetical protein